MENLARQKFILSGLLSLGVFVLVMAFCTLGQAGEEVKIMADKAVLKGISYETVNGMIYGEDFKAYIRQERIVKATYFKEQGRGEYVDVANRPLSAENWQSLEKAVEALLPILKEIEPIEPERLEKLAELPVATDGPNYSKFFLTWQAPSGEEYTKEYYRPQDKRFFNLRNLLEEVVNPRGRESI